MIQVKDLKKRYGDKQAVDGISFSVYTTTNGLPNNNILAIHCVGTQVYIGTIGGLTRYNGATFYNYNTGNGLLPCDSVYCIQSENEQRFHPSARPSRGISHCVRIERSGVCRLDERICHGVESHR